MGKWHKGETQIRVVVLQSLHDVARFVFTVRSICHHHLKGKSRFLLQPQWKMAFHPPIIVFGGKDYRHLRTRGARGRLCVSYARRGSHEGKCLVPLLARQTCEFAKTPRATQSIDQRTTDEE